MSVSSTEMKFDATNWATANVTPTDSATGHVSRTPRAPSTSRTSSSGTMTASSGVCRPT